MMRVAIVGCGQLARMLALSGIPLGIQFSFLADDEESARNTCIEGLGRVVPLRDNVKLHDVVKGRALFDALGQPEVITAEKEAVPMSALQSLAEHARIAPSLNAISMCQHRYREKSFLDYLNIPTARYFYVQSLQEAERALLIFDQKVVIKSTSQGYDGKQQWRVEKLSELKQIPSAVWQEGAIMEQFVPFDKEVSLIGVRSLDGDIKFYPATENVHQDGILIQSIAPTRALSIQQSRQMEDHLTRIMESLQYVGVMAMECFLYEGKVLVNELAPRVHNSGHWTQEGAAFCQFENHIRAITGMPLGSTELHGVAGMVNLLGAPKPPMQLLTEHSTLHWYGKSVRPGRKLGHVNFVSNSFGVLKQNMDSFQLAVNERQRIGESEHDTTQL